MALIPQNNNPVNGCEYLHNVKDLRFCINLAGPKNLSNLWFIRTKKSEVYVGCRSMPGSKISLHESGQCHYKSSDGAGRCVIQDKWDISWVNDSWAHPLTVVFPTDMIFAWRRGETINKKWMTISHAEAGKAVELAICRVKNGIDLNNIPLGTVCASMPLRDGTYVAVFYKVASYNITMVPEKELSYFAPFSLTDNCDLGLMYLRNDGVNLHHRAAINVQGRLKDNMPDPAKG